MRLLLLVLFGLVLSGCRDAAQPAPSTASSRPAPASVVVLRVLVVDDPELATGVQLLSGEWNERTGGEIAVEEISLTELLDAKQVTTDLVIYPTRHLGTLVDRGWLRPVRRSVLEDPGFDLADLLPAIRDRVIRYGGETYALPLGDPPLVLVSDNELSAKDIDTWDAIDNLLRRFPSAAKAEFPYPLSGELLARSLAATPARDWPALLFDSLTMQARLDVAPVRRAVERMAAQSGSDDDSEGSPIVGVSVPSRGEAVLGWFTSLPRSADWYEASLDRWQPHDAPASPTILGFSGRLISVTQTSRNAVSAFALLPWLTGGMNATQLSQRSDGTLWFRSSQSARAEAWLTPRHAGNNLTTQLTQQMSRVDVFLFPRLPGVDEYLLALERWLEAAVQGEVPPLAALKSIESEWNDITERYGAERQQTAYRKHLGVE